MNIPDITKDAFNHMLNDQGQDDTDQDQDQDNTLSTFEVGYFYANCNGCGEIVRTGGTLYAAIRQTD